MPTLTTVQLQVLELRCTCCAEAVLDAVRALPGITRPELDYQSGRLTVDLDAEQASEQVVRDAINAAGYRTADDPDRRSTGQLAHHTEMTPTTCCTKGDRMQYELPHPRAPQVHTEPGEHAHGGHGGMDHDMASPATAAAMERDMRNRFFIALL